MGSIPIRPHYKDLLAGQFRLLRFEQHGLSGTYDPTACQISAHDLEDCPPYVALSYAWHEPEATAQCADESQYVRLNSQTVSATPNLACALRQLASLQPKYDLEYLWVDALCIDQSSDGERTSQVSMMHEIYRKASLVLVWLGPDPDKAAYEVRELLRALLQKYSEGEEDIGGVYSTTRYSNRFLAQNDEQDLIDAGLPVMNSVIWRKVVKFWDRAWFSRVWVQQEIGLARSSSFWCGDVEFTQKDLVQSSYFFSHSGLGSSLMIVRRNMQRLRQHMVAGRPVGGSAVRISKLQSWASGTSLSEGRNLKQSADRMTGPPQLHSESQIANPLIRQLGMQLHMSYRDDCTDQRDRIFALLILLRQVAKVHGLPELPLQTDYNKSVAAVYTETTAYIIENTAWLGLLSLIHPKRRCDSDCGIPSWVPALDSDTLFPLRVFHWKMEAQITKHAEMIAGDTKPSIQGPKLFVSVKRIGVVQDVGNSLQDHLEHGMFDATAKVLLATPSEMRPGYTRIDCWIDVIDLVDQASGPPREARRQHLRHWSTFSILRKIKEEQHFGRIKLGREFLARMPNLEVLAQADVTKTIPTLEEWIAEIGQPENVSKILNKVPRFWFDEICYRKLFRIADFTFPHCPVACMLGLGPETMIPGDEVFQVAGSVMPLILRGTAESAKGAMPQARVVGEGFICGFDAILSRLEDRSYERLELI